MCKFEKMKVLEKETRKNPVQEIASIIKRLGNPVSTILLDSPCSVFCIPEVDGIIGYQLAGDRVVVLGDPICLPENIAELTRAFQEHCEKHNLRIIYFLVSDSFARRALNNGCDTLVEAAEELIIDPTVYQKKQKLRWKINQSISSGVVIKEYKNSDPIIENQIKKTIDSWLKGKHGPQIHLGDLEHFIPAVDKRIFYAIQNDKVIGLLKLSPIDSFEGWVLSASFAISEAPVGASEHLMSFAFDTLASENCHFLCIGAIAGKKLGEIIGMTNFSKLVAQVIFKISKKIFKLDAKRVYLCKFRPRLTPLFFVVSGKLSFKDLMALKEILHVRLCFQ